MLNKRKHHNKKTRIILPLTLFIILCIFLLTCGIEYTVFIINYIYYTFTYNRYIKDEYIIKSDTYLSSSFLSNNKVPKIIHQTYKDNINIPLHWINTSKSCRDIHNINNDWTLMFWTDETAREFIKTHYSKEDLDNYDSYPYNIQRVDALRYYILSYYGGIYIDMDIGCRKTLEPLLQYDFIIPFTTPIGFSNDFIVSIPHHPFIEYMIKHLKEYNRQYLNYYYTTVMFSTGPMYLTSSYIQYMKEINERHEHNIEYISSSSSIKHVNNYVFDFINDNNQLMYNMYFMDDSLYAGSLDNRNSDVRLFDHVEGSSWWQK